MLALAFATACREGPAPTCDAPGPRATDAALLTLQGAALDRAKAANFACPFLWGADVRNLMFSANKKSKEPVRSVHDKTGLAPSGDKRDYFSIGRYFWPNEATADGLPWRRRDGSPNPEVFSGAYDKGASDAMFAAVSSLATAYFFLGDEAYAQRAVAHLNAWFIDPATAMNPNLTHAEAVPGVAEGRSQGLIEFHKLVDLIDALAFLDQSAAWKGADQATFRAWMARYYEWTETHPNALGEAKAKNNHGTYFDVQQAALALYLGKTADATRILEGVKTRRIASQVLPSGEQPEEVLRANSWYYSVFNLRAFLDLAAMGQRVGVDLWGFQTEDGRSIRGALDYLVGFGFEGKVWPYIGGMELGRLYEPLLRASAALEEPRYARLAESLGDTDHDGDTLDDEKSRGIVHLLWSHAAER